MYTGVIFILPEIVISVMSCIILLFDVFISKSKRSVIYYLSLLALIFSAISIFYLREEPRCILFDGAFVFDSFSILLKLAIIFIALVIFIYSRKYIVYIDLYKGEYFALCLMSILGMMVMISSGTFLTLYLGLELLSLPIYSLIVMNKSNVSSEASMKYFIMGSVASGIFLFGVSLVYGITGAIELNLINKVIVEEKVFSNTTLQYGLVFIISGLVFKFGAVPFHMWVPDVYEGSPVPIALFVSTIPKIAALGMSYRLLSDTFSSVNNELEFLFIIIGIASLFVGNIFAISQLNIKRLLAYSAIAHVGFIFLGFIVSDSNDFSSVIFYVIVYVISSLGAFGIIMALSSKLREAELINDFKGLGLSKPIFGVTMVLFLLSLAGVPPTAGFYAKFFILNNLIYSGYLELAIFALLMSVIGAFYYLKVIKVMFFEECDENCLENVKIFGMNSLGMAIILINGMVILFVGVFPKLVLNYCFV
ncbi:MAG TPA: NADH-quinone oxidoreductase subunit N [Candidatus Azoamicus sp. OHIO1]